MVDDIFGHGFENGVFGDGFEAGDDQGNDYCSTNSSPESANESGIEEVPEFCFYIDSFLEESVVFNNLLFRSEVRLCFGGFDPREDWFHTLSMANQS